MPNVYVRIADYLSTDSYSEYNGICFNIAEAVNGTVAGGNMDLYIELKAMLRELANKTVPCDPYDVHFYIKNPLNLDNQSAYIEAANNKQLYDKSTVYGKNRLTVKYSFIAALYQKGYELENASSSRVVAVLVALTVLTACIFAFI